MIAGRLLLTPQQGKLRALLYNQQAVAQEAYRDDGKTVLEIRVPKSDLLRLLKTTFENFDDLQWAD
jgi:GTP-binding protein HflX